MRLLVYVVDYPTGVCLFKKTWRWTRGAPCISSGISNLIVSFFQLSNSLGTEPPNRVVFEEDALLSLKKDKSRKKPATMDKRQRTVGCAFATSTDSQKEGHFLIAALFYYGRDTLQASECANDIIQEFLCQYGESLKSLAPILEDVIDDKAKCSVTPEDILEKFRAFESALEDLTTMQGMDQRPAQPGRLRAGKGGSNAVEDEHKVHAGGTRKSVKSKGKSSKGR